MEEGKLRNIRYYRDADGVYLHADDLAVALRSAASAARTRQVREAVDVVVNELDRLRRKAQGGEA